MPPLGWQAIATWLGDASDENRLFSRLGYVLTGEVVQINEKCLHQKKQKNVPTARVHGTPRQASPAPAGEAVFSLHCFTSKVGSLVHTVSNRTRSWTPPGCNAGTPSSELAQSSQHMSHLISSTPYMNRRNIKKTTSWSWEMANIDETILHEVGFCTWVGQTAAGKKWRCLLSWYPWI